MFVPSPPLKILLIPLLVLRLVLRVYGAELDEKLRPAAARGLLLHLAKLEEEGKVKEPGETWELTDAKLSVKM